MTASQTGSTAGILRSAGATIGTTTKMISKASMTKPRRKTAIITITIAPAAPSAKHQAKQRRPDQDEEDHAGHLRGARHDRNEHAQESATIELQRGERNGADRADGGSFRRRGHAGEDRADDGEDQKDRRNQ